MVDHQFLEETLVRKRTQQGIMLAPCVHLKSLLALANLQNAGSIFSLINYF